MSVLSRLPALGALRSLPGRPLTLTVGRSRPGSSLLLAVHGVGDGGGWEGERGVPGVGSQPAQVTVFLRASVSLWTFCVISVSRYINITLFFPA